MLRLPARILYLPVKLVLVVFSVNRPTPVFVIKPLPLSVKEAAPGRDSPALAADVTSIVPPPAPMVTPRVTLSVRALVPLYRRVPPLIVTAAARATEGTRPSAVSPVKSTVPLLIVSNAPLVVELVKPSEPPRDSTPGLF